MKIILDTNFLLDAIKFRIDIFSEIERISDFKYSLSILDKTLDELKEKKNEKLVKDIISSKNINIIRTKGGYVDDILTEIADKDTIIATQDKELKKRLKEKGIKILIIRAKSHLKFE